MKDIHKKLDESGVSIRSKFVPWSQSRNKDEQYRTLNWRVTLVYKGRDVLTTDYSAGIAHAPSYKNWNPAKHGNKNSLLHSRFLQFEAEQGREAVAFPGAPGVLTQRGGKEILPDAANVVCCLVTDARYVLDAGGFEQWAVELGFDPDSRKAEAIWKTCIEHALAIRSHLGEPLMYSLVEAFEEAGY